MNRERILRDFSIWLDERDLSSVVPSADSPVVREENPREAVNDEPDLMTLMSALVALKEEVRRLPRQSLNQTERPDVVRNEWGSSMPQGRNDPVVECLIDVSDRLERNIEAFGSIERKRSFLPWISRRSPELITALDGLRMTQESIRDVLSSKGVVSRDAAGQIFDPAWMQAIAIESVSGSEGKVLRHCGRAYFRGETVVRYARVVVGADGKEPNNG